MAPPPSTPTWRSPTSPQSPVQPARPPTPPYLSYLSSPAPDLAATLHTESQEALEADEANVDFLRSSLESLDQASRPERQSQTRIDPERDPRRAGQAQPAVQADSRPAASQSRPDNLEDLTRRERLQRVLSRLNRLHEPTASSSSAYSNRTPSPNRQSIYDWAPSYNDNNANENELDAILNELRRQQPETHPDILRVLSQSQLDGARQREGNGTPAPGTTAAEAAERRDRLRERERRRRETEWVSLRTRAAIQRSRQESSPSSTERMLRYVMERERSGMSEEEDRARTAGWFRPSPNRGTNEQQSHLPSTQDTWNLLPPANETRDRERQQRIEAFRRSYLSENVPPRLPRISTPAVPDVSALSSSASTFLENALKYLSELRTCSRYEESLSTAIDHGLATKEFFADKHDDFIMDLQSMQPLQYSSWLQPGTVFDGHQHANSGCLSHHSRSSSGTVTHVVEQVNPRYVSRGTGNTTFDHPPGSTRIAAPPAFDASRPWLSHRPTFGGSKQNPDATHDHWPVRVILHSVDPNQMTLQGTMEAYDVPQHPASLSILNTAHDRPKAGRKNAPITTYVEGHIIDLKTHSFLTPGSSKHDGLGKDAKRLSETPGGGIAFPCADAATDAANWRKLPPFNALPSDDETARLLLSQARMDEVNQQYIFMRWKERCFVHGKDDKCSASPTARHSDQDRGHGLTISGFYYVSLRRDNGVVEGLYFDPTSTPYQHLRLRGQYGGWPAFEFR